MGYEMVSKFLPSSGEIYFINQYTLLHILEGQGAIQVDFKNYFDWKDKLIFLEKGQYIKFLSDSFVIRRIEFDDEIVFRHKDVRVLFKHLVSLGYIDFNTCEACQEFLTNTVFQSDAQELIDISSTQWFWQNPFSASKDEYTVIFDAKDVVDQQFKNHLNVHQLSTLLNQGGYDVFSLVKERLGISVKGLLSKKRLTESKKEIVFSGKSIKEIAYDMGYKDPAYFSRAFKKTTGLSPDQFRTEFDFHVQDSFLAELYYSIRTHHKEERSVAFYADEMNMSVKALSNSVKKKLSTTLGQLIRQEIIHTAKALLTPHTPIHEVAFHLGFEESNHFSSFFKHHTGQTPSEFIKYKR